MIPFMNVSIKQKLIKNSARFFSSTPKQILFSNEGRSKMLAGVNKIANAVQVTLGPKGRNVAIDQPFGACRITKDGVTVAKAIDLGDKIENMGAQHVKNVASKTNEGAGDGTTTSTVLFRALFAASFKAVAAGHNPVDVQRGLIAATKIVKETLENNAKQISTPEIQQVATISANNESSVGKLISDCMAEVGRNGVISVESGHKLEDEFEIVRGMQFERGLAHSIFVNDVKSQKAVYERPYILVVEGKITEYEGIIQLLDKSRSSGRPFVVIADEVDGAALSTLILNRLKGAVECCVLKAPGFGDNRSNLLADLSAATGATYITKIGEKNLKDLSENDLGSCDKLEASMNSALFIRGHGDKHMVAKRVESLKGSLKNSDTSDYEKEKIKERIGKLSDGVAVIKIGGGSEVAVGEKKDRVTDALNATRAAVEKGIVIGGGTSLLYASNALLNFEGANSDQTVGGKILREALRQPALVICNNAGLDGPAITGRLLEDSNGRTDVTLGMNAANGKYVDMFKEGIIDPLKVVSSALSDSSSVAGVMLTTEAVICDEPGEKKPDAADSMSNMM